MSYYTGYVEGYQAGHAAALREIEMDANYGRRIRVSGDERGYRVYSIERDGSSHELPNVNTVTITFHKSGHAEAIVYFSKVELAVEAPRSADGVRAG